MASVWLVNASHVDMRVVNTFLHIYDSVPNDESSWMPHAKQSLSFTVIRPTFNGCSTMMSLHSVFNPHAFFLNTSREHLFAPVHLTWRERGFTSETWRVNVRSHQRVTPWNERASLPNKPCQRLDGGVTARRASWRATAAAELTANVLAPWEQVSSCPLFWAVCSPDVFSSTWSYWRGKSARCSH